MFRSADAIRMLSSIVLPFKFLFLALVLVFHKKGQGKKLIFKDYPLGGREKRRD